MQTVAATPIDVAKEYQGRIGGLPLRFAFMLYQPDRNTITFTTFFESVDTKSETELAENEAYMVDAFPEYTLDFRTIHLMGRDLLDFLPEGAIPLMPSIHKSAHRRADVK